MGARRTDATMAILCALAPACLAASHIANVPDGAHDAGVVRVLGLAAQPWRALDVAAGNALAMLPLGTRAARAVMGGMLVTGAAGATLYALFRALLAECAKTRRLGPLVAAVAAVLPLVCSPWQIEASAVGGSVVGALLSLLPLAFAVRAGSSAHADALRTAAAFSLGLAIGHEPLVGLCAVAGCGAFVLATCATRDAWREALARASTLMPAFGLGLAPFAIALGHTRGLGEPIAGALGATWSGERGASHAGSPLPFARAEIGPVLALLALAGSALAMFVRLARPAALALAATASVGLAAAWLGAPVGPTRFGGPVLAGLAATAGLAAVAMQATVRAVAQARVPMARTSASMILLLEVVMPVDRADDAFARASGRATNAGSDWSDATWGALPPRSAVLVPDRRLYERARADEACGSVRPDLALLPTYPGAAAAWRRFADDASLVPLRRDLELTQTPSEESLSTLAVRRPVAAAFDAAWGRAVARHLVPLSLLDRFEPEPRGASDRRRALDALVPARDRLARAVAADPELVAAAGALLRARVSGVALDGDKDVLARVVADVDVFDEARPRR
jgi:hypothetical protein